MHVIDFLDSNEMSIFTKKVNTKYIMKKPLNFFLGKQVYIKLDVIKKGETIPDAEWIWVTVIDINNNYLIGVVDVDPQFVNDVKFKNELCIKRKDIGMIQIVDLVVSFAKSINGMRYEDIDMYYDEIFEYIIKSNLDGSFYE